MCNNTKADEVKNRFLEEIIMIKQKFAVTGMTCSACSAHVEKSVRKLDGVTSVSVNVLTNSMQVEYNDEALTKEQIVEAVEKAGYGASAQGAGYNSGLRMAEHAGISEHSATSERAGISEGAATSDGLRISESARISIGARTEETANKSSREGRKRFQGQMDQAEKAMKHRLIISISFLIPLMYISMHHMFFEWFALPIPNIVKTLFHGNENALAYGFAQFLLLLPIIYVNQQYFRTGFKMLLRRSPNMDSLIAIGALAATVYGIFAIFRIGYGLGHGNMELVAHYSMDIYFESAGTILALITVGKYLETKSKGKTSEAITKLMNLAPKTAVIEVDGVQKEIPAEQLKKDDIVVVKPGSSIPVDGVIVMGMSTIDESAITGESIPVSKTVSDTVVTATVNKTGFFKFRATKVGDDTTLAQIIRLVEDASASKAPIAKLADSIAGVFVPIVIVIALLTFVIWLLLGAGFEFAMSTGIAVLVISCPCALGLATPVAIMVGTGKGAENGILIKSGEALQTARNIDTVVLDKTGTITEGKPRVTDILCYQNDMNDNAFLVLAAGLEEKSEHPLAEAVVEEAESRHIKWQDIEEFEAIFGKGIKGKLNHTHYYAGNIALMEENKIVVSDAERKNIAAFAAEGKTPLIFADEKKLIGIIAVADTIKATSKHALEAFEKMGIDTIMLTGDNKVTAEAIRKKLHMKKAIAEVLPEDKEKKIRELKQAGKCVAMIGDGINDAPALASADVGIAIGAGTDIAIESADVVLMKSDLLDAVKAIQISKATIRNIKQNLFWAFFYNCIGIPLAAGLLYPMFGVRLNPMFGAAAMSLSSVCVVVNALRLRGMKLTVQNTQEKNDNERSDKENPRNKENMNENKTNQKNVNNKNELSKRREREENRMVKVITIEGMMCAHCTGAVEKALSATDGVEAVVVNLEEKTATVRCQEEVNDEVLGAAVTEAGYEVKNIK